MYDRLLLFLMFLCVQKDEKSRFLCLSVWSTFLTYTNNSFVSCINMYSKMIMIMSQKAYVLIIPLLYPHIIPDLLEPSIYTVNTICLCIVILGCHFFASKRNKTIDPDLVDVIKSLTFIIYAFNWQISATLLFLCELYRFVNDAKIGFIPLYALCLCSQTLTFYSHFLSVSMVLLGLFHDVIPDHHNIEDLIFNAFMTYMSKSVIDYPEDLGLSVGTLWLYFYL